MTRPELADLLRSHEPLRVALRVAESHEQHEHLRRGARLLIRRGRWRTKEESKLLFLFNLMIQDYEAAPISKGSIGRVPTQETCPEKTALICKCDEAAQVYSRAIRELRRRMGASTIKECGDLYSKAEYARMDMERARLDYERHTGHHGC